MSRRELIVAGAVVVILLVAWWAMGWVSDHVTAGYSIEHN